MSPHHGIPVASVAVLAPRVADVLFLDRLLSDGLVLIGSVIIALLVALLLT